MGSQKIKTSPIKTNMPKTLQAQCGDTASFVPDHRDKASITIKPGVIFLLMEGFAFNL